MNHENIISKLTLEEKIAMIHAAGLFRSGAVKRLNIPSLVMSDGPSGVRQEFENDSWTPIDDTTDFVSWLQVIHVFAPRGILTLPINLAKC